MSYMKLNVPRAVYERRIARMAELIEMKAPAIIIYHEARLIQEAYRPNWWHRFTWWLQSTRVGMWWTLLGYEEPEWNPKFGGVTDDGTNLWINAGPAWDEAGIKRLLAAIAEAPPVSFDAETATLTCGHAPDKWYSICSAHYGPYQDADCPRCKVGRCIECYPTLPGGKLVFFNREDGSEANPFPNLR